MENQITRKNNRGDCRISFENLAEHLREWLKWLDSADETDSDSSETERKVKNPKTDRRSIDDSGSGRGDEWGRRDVGGESG